MHVGDSWQEDILPAQQLGMHAVWIAEKEDQTLPPRVHRIAHIKELPQLLETLEKRHSGGIQPLIQFL